MRRRMIVNNAKLIGIMGAALFVSAGTWRFAHAWLFLALHVAWLAFAGAYFLRTDPALVERRMTQDERGEKEPVQQRIIRVLRVMGLAHLVVAGLDFRFGWSRAPAAVTAAGVALFVAGVAVVFAVFRENTHASSIIEVEANQKVVATGPYRFLRHPMYAGTILMGFATPLVLGSYWSALLIPPGWVLLVMRILAEEKLLSQQLPGYAAYMQRTRTRLIPGVW
jgi:protein-S-isoprenylcysteine O-methyltransferase Ste14